MKKILMILTHNRLDCLKLCLDMLEHSGSMAFFDTIVFLLNGVPKHHLRYVLNYIQRRPNIHWDTLFGSGTRPDGISSLQNACIQKYPNSIYMKIDEDIFVPTGWAERMYAVYQYHQNLDNLALITPLIPNNSYGLHFLLTHLYPELLTQHRECFHCDPTSDINSHTWHNPKAGEWATRQFIHLDKANERHKQKLRSSEYSSYHSFNDRFSIGCICYDYNHWLKMAGIPREDEPAWCQWISDNNQINILDPHQIVLHYSFFVQQDWLDRTHLLEDIRKNNLPETLKGYSVITNEWLRYMRIIKQVPNIMRRNLFKTY